MCMSMGVSLLNDDNDDDDDVDGSLVLYSLLWMMIQCSSINHGILQMMVMMMFRLIDRRTE